MSKVGSTYLYVIMEIEELHARGLSAFEIAKVTGTTLSFVEGILEELEGPDWPEPEGDFNT